MTDEADESGRARRATAARESGWGDTAGAPEITQAPEPVGVAHPGPARVQLPTSIVAAIVANARAGVPDEACGLVIGDREAAGGGRALRFEPTRNRAASPYLYEIEPDDLLRLTLAIDDADEAFWAIVHSHVATPAVPSPTDIRLALYPDALYVLVSLAPDQADPLTGDPSLRAWRIVGGAVHEVAVTVADSTED